MINIQLTLIDEKQTRLTSFFIIYHQQMGFLLFVARVLIVTALASSAYHHLNAPQTSVLEFQTNYKILDTLSNQYLSFDIPYDNVPSSPLRPTGSPVSSSSDSSKPSSPSSSSSATPSAASSTWCQSLWRYSSWYGPVSLAKLWQAGTSSNCKRYSFCK